jgi:spermidine/putrescine transport system permease protein
MSWNGFTLHWYNELFFNDKYDVLWESLWNTLIIAATSATFSTAIGTLGAIGLYWYSFKFKKVIRAAAFIPMLIPEIIIGVSLLIFFAGIHLKLSLFTIFLAHMTFNIPFVLLIVMARLEEFDFTIIEAAHDLGAGEFQALNKIIIPTALPGIISGFLIAVTLSLEDFVITFFVKGPEPILPIRIHSMITGKVPVDTPVVYALSVVIIAGTIVLAALSRNVVKYMFQK